MRFGGHAFLIIPESRFPNLSSRLQLLKDVHQLTGGEWREYNIFHRSLPVAVGFSDQFIAKDTLQELKNFAQKHQVTPFYSFKDDPEPARIDLARHLRRDWLKASKPSSTLLDLLV